MRRPTIYFALAYTVYIFEIAGKLLKSLTKGLKSILSFQENHSRFEMRRFHDFEISKIVDFDSHVAGRNRFKKNLFLLFLKESHFSI